jgi:hypothetical protein
MRKELGKEIESLKLQLKRSELLVEKANCKIKALKLNKQTLMGDVSHH